MQKLILACIHLQNINITITSKTLFINIKIESLANMKGEKGQERLKLQEYMPCFNPEYPKGYEEGYMSIKEMIEREQFTQQLNDLIEKLIPFGETNYTCWIAKKKILQAGNSTIDHEDEYSADLLLDNLKNFQIWDFRTFIFEQTRDHEKEYRLMDEVLEESPKNYHCWSSRVRVVDLVKNYQQEIIRTQHYIDEDIFNNSPWTYRFHCFKALAEKDFKAELSFVFSYIRKGVDNEAAWNYLRGFFPSHRLPQMNFNQNKSILSFSDYPEVESQCLLITEDPAVVPEQQKVQAYLTLSIIYSQSDERVGDAKKMCEILMQLEVDRRTYYEWVMNNL